ncbi:serine/arginine repetitive matrix protein 2 [Anopheles ziemanni]|uniref:serine/arginine repetitive matrix protein 2 n=1 Tax=Anopheles coustani TaxID=139045 RepID=UPI00265A6341|nr:serine/arginine repetitive matrix protein 2 [Anopheles coustani]XP_058178811.1 serine/arginine repetitive matrix protein 2 [Anopheles ziemanni]
MGNQPTKHTTGKPKKAVHWKSAEPPAPPGKPVLVPGTPSSAPDIVTIRWNRPPTDGGSPILGYVVEQRRTGSPHWVRPCPSLIQQTELSLSGLEPGWRYQFRVMAENIVGRSESSELSDPLTVTLQRNAISAPRFVHELFDATAVENEKVEFRVQVAGTPAPQISWFKDGFEIYSSRRARIVTEGDASVLVIHQTALTDEGEIKCAATNRAGHSVTRCHLTIDALPKIRLPRQYEDGLIIAAEEVVRLKVGLAGRPAPAVEWTHNGEPLANDARHEIVTSDKHTTLKLTASQRADRGEYNIRAINKLGEDNASFLVTVTARPEPPGKVTVSFSYGKTATLSWAAPDDDGGCEIGNYIVEYYRVGWDVWLKAATCRQLSATLNDLIEGSQYRFRVKAENPYGLSDPSEESEVLFVADPKRGITDPSKMASSQPATLPRKRRDQSRSPLRDTAGSRPKKAFTPEPYGRADVIREMSYGTPIQGYQSYPQEPPSAVGLPEVVITEPSAGAPLAEPESETEFNDPPASASLQAMQKLSREPSPLSHSSPTNSLDPMGSSSVNGDAQGRDDTQPSQKAAIHNSSEFMLVLYNEQEAKKSTRNSTFDFELDELVAPPPPLSLSAPELNVEPPPAPTMRAGVSSSELLYERAMARFYQAVAFEESENQRKEALEQELAARNRQQAAVGAQDHGMQEEKGVTTTTVSNRLADRRSSLRKRLSGDKESIVKQSSFEQEQQTHQQQPASEPQQQLLSHSTLAEETIVEEPQSEHLDSGGLLGLQSEEGDEDSVSSSMSSMLEEMKRREQQQKLLEQQFMAHQKRRGFMDDDDTDEEPYHPGGQRTRSPYRNPDPSQAIEILTRPMPRPDPNFVPKPILKRPSTEILAKDEQTARKPITQPVTLQTIQPAQQREPSPQKTPEREKSPIARMGSPAPPRSPTPPALESPRQEDIPRQQEEKQGVDEPEYPLSQKQPPAQEDITRAIVSEVARQRRLESRQNSIEESRAVADFYSDMVQQIESSKKPRKLPLYMSPDEVRKLNEREYSRNSSRAGSRSPLPLDESYLIHSRRTSRSPSLSTDHPAVMVVQRSGKPARESKILRQRSASIESDVTSVRLPSVVRDAQVPAGGPPPVIREENGRIGRPVEKRRGSATTGATIRNRSRSNSAARTGALAGPKPKLAPPVTPPASSAITSNTPRPVDLKQSSPEPPSLPTTPPKAIEPESQPTTSDSSEVGLKPTVSYLTDVALFAIACWLYLFKNPKLAIPVILLIMYRHIREAVKDKIPAWMRRKEATS